MKTKTAITTCRYLEVELHLWHQKVGFESFEKLSLGINSDLRLNSGSFLRYNVSRTCYANLEEFKFDIKLPMMDIYMYILVLNDKSGSVLWKLWNLSCFFVHYRKTIGHGLLFGNRAFKHLYTHMHIVWLMLLNGFQKPIALQKSYLYIKGPIY